MEMDELIMSIWHHVLKENKEVFITDRDEIFQAMKIVLLCNEIGIGEGYLAMEEFVDGECGVAQGEMPLWEYLRAAVRIIVDVPGIMVLDDMESKKMMAGMFLANGYTGCQAVQGCIYLIGMSMFLDRVRGDKVLKHFRSLVPDEVKREFNQYFQPMLEG